MRAFGICYVRPDCRHGTTTVAAESEAGAVAAFQASHTFRELDRPRVVRVGRIGTQPRLWPEANRRGGR